MRRYLTSSSAAVNTAGSALLCASPTYLNAVGLAGAGSGLASWYAGSALSGASLLWTLTTSPSNYAGQTFNAPILVRTGLIVNVISGCANTAWGL